MKYVMLAILLLCSAAIYAQRDFDYSIYTDHSLSSHVCLNDSSSIELVLQRRIVKEANVLKIIPIGSTGNAYEYKLSFQGFTWLDKKSGYKFIDNDDLQMFFYYTSGDVFKDNYLVFYINPVIPVVIIRKSNDYTYYEKYY